jgi:hypothetical protein
LGHTFENLKTSQLPIIAGIDQMARCSENPAKYCTNEKNQAGDFFLKPHLVQ